MSSPYRPPSYAKLISSVINPYSIGLTLPMTLLASIFRMVGPDGTFEAGALLPAEEDVEAAVGAGTGATTLVSAPDLGMISIAQIWGFSTFGVKVTLILPSATSTGTVST